MFDEDSLKLLTLMLQSSPEIRKEFWQKLEDDCIKNGMYPGFYCPYIPLQMYSQTGGIEDSKKNKTICK